MVFQPWEQRQTLLDREVPWPRSVRQTTSHTLDKEVDEANFQVSHMRMHRRRKVLATSCTHQKTLTGQLSREIKDGKNFYHTLRETCTKKRLQCPKRQGNL